VKNRILVTCGNQKFHSDTVSRRDIALAAECACFKVYALKFAIALKVASHLNVVGCRNVAVTVKVAPYNDNAGIVPVLGLHVAARTCNSGISHFRTCCGVYTDLINEHTLKSRGGNALVKACETVLVYICVIVVLVRSIKSEVGDRVNSGVYLCNAVARVLCRRCKESVIRLEIKFTALGVNKLVSGRYVDVYKVCAGCVSSVSGAPRNGIGKVYGNKVGLAVERLGSNAGYLAVYACALVVNVLRDFNVNGSVSVFHFLGNGAAALEHLVVFLNLALEVNPKVTRVTGVGTGRSIISHLLRAVFGVRIPVLTDSSTCRTVTGVKVPSYAKFSSKHGSRTAVVIEGVVKEVGPSGAAEGGPTVNAYLHAYTVIVTITPRAVTCVPSEFVIGDALIYTVLTNGVLPTRFGRAVTEIFVVIVRSGGGIKVTGVVDYYVLLIVVDCTGTVPRPAGTKSAVTVACISLPLPIVQVVLFTRPVAEQGVMPGP